MIVCRLCWHSDLTMHMIAFGLINHFNWAHCSGGMTVTFCWRLQRRPLLTPHCVPGPGWDAVMCISHLRHTHFLCYVVSSHFRGEKTETQASELGQGHTTSKDLRAKTPWICWLLGWGCSRPFHFMVQVLLTSGSKRACRSEQGAPWRWLYKIPLSEGITATKEYSGQKTLW